MKMQKYDPEMVVDYSWLQKYGDDTPIDAGYIPRGRRKAAGASRFPRLAKPGTIPLADLQPPKKGEKCTIAWQAARKVREMVREADVNAADELTARLYRQIGRDDQLPTYYQQTGSCVGNGSDKAVLYTMAIEVAVRKEPERFAQTFMPYLYGRSRSHAGMGGREGEGSFGSAAAKAARTDGVLLASADGLPQPEYRDGLTWGQRVEYDWSAGDRIDEAYIEQANDNPVRIAEIVTDVDTYRDHIRSGRVGTIASTWGGRMRPRVQGSGDLACLLNERVTTWAHLMMCSAWWWHPEFGELFYIDNSWSESAHGVDPAGGPLGGFWIRRADMAWILSQRDSAIFAGLVGFPGEEQGIDYSWLLDYGINLRTAA